MSRNRSNRKNAGTSPQSSPVDQQGSNVPASPVPPVVIETSLDAGRDDKGTINIEGRITSPVRLLIRELSPEQLQRERDALLNNLRNATSRNAKKRIRAGLRRRGHFGGLGIARGIVASPE
jgi:hypothetical protein